MLRRILLTLLVLAAPAASAVDILEDAEAPPTPTDPGVVGWLDGDDCTREAPEAVCQKVDARHLLTGVPVSGSGAISAGTYYVYVEVAGCVEAPTSNWCAGREGEPLAVSMLWEESNGISGLQRARYGGRAADRSVLI